MLNGIRLNVKDKIFLSMKWARMKVDDTNTRQNHRVTFCYRLKLCVLPKFLEETKYPT